MEYGYYEQTGSPLRGRTLGELREFLARAELTYDENIQFTVLIRDGEDNIAAAAFELLDTIIQKIVVLSAGKVEMIFTYADIMEKWAMSAPLLPERMVSGNG